MAELGFVVEPEINGGVTVDENTDGIFEKEPKEEKIVKPEKKEGIVIGGKLNLRKKPIAGSDVIKVLDDGKKVTIISDKNNLFFKVGVDGVEGYCMKKFIKKVK